MYLAHFGLDEPPFRITPHTEFFFEGANRGATLEALLYTIANDEGIVKVTGEITLKKNRGTLLHDKVRGLVQDGHRRVLIDLADVSYVDSAGLGKLVQANSTAKNLGGSMKLFSPSARLRELLVVTRLTTVLGVYDDEAQALASYGAHAN